MKKFLVIITLLAAFIGASTATVQAQATRKGHIEIYSLTKPLGIKINIGELVYRADSGFWIIMDSTFAKTDSGATIVRKGSAYFHFNTDGKQVKYTAGADSASTILRTGAERATATHLWLKVNGSWKKLKFD